LWIAFHSGSSARVAIGALSAAMFLGYAAHLLLSDWAIRKRIQQVHLGSIAEVAIQPEYADSTKL